MTEKLVPTVRTSVTMQDFARGVLLLWPEATKEGCGVLWSQYAGETGDGQHCYGWNLGNVKYTKGCGYDYQALRGVFEYVNGKRIELPPSHPGAWFRVYPSLETGMTSFLTSKMPGGRWAKAWPSVLAGDCAGYAVALHLMHYYTASPESYTALMLVKFAAWMKSDAFDQALRFLATVPASEESDHLPDTTPDFPIAHPFPDHPPRDIDFGDE